MIHHYTDEKLNQSTCSEACLERHFATEIIEDSGSSSSNYSADELELLLSGLQNW